MSYPSLEFDREMRNSFPVEISNLAYSLASKAYGQGHAEAKNELAARFPKLPWDDLIEVYLAACSLHQTAYSVASDVRDKKFSEAEAKSRLQQMCPGFSNEAYNKDFADGMYESLW
jgi:hypothetical protein